MRFRRKKKEKISEGAIKRLIKLLPLEFLQSDISEIVPDLQLVNKKKKSNSTAIKYDFAEIPSDVKEFDVEWKDDVSELDINIITEKIIEDLDNGDLDND